MLGTFYVFHSPIYRENWMQLSSPIILDYSSITRSVTDFSFLLPPGLKIYHHSSTLRWEKDKKSSSHHLYPSIFFIQIAQKLMLKSPSSFFLFAAAPNVMCTKPDGFGGIESTIWYPFCWQNTFFPLVIITSMPLIIIPVLGI